MQGKYQKLKGRRRTSSMRNLRQFTGMTFIQIFWSAVDRVRWAIMIVNFHRKYRLNATDCSNININIMNIIICCQIYWHRLGVSYLFKNACIQNYSTKVWSSFYSICNRTKTFSSKIRYTYLSVTGFWVNAIQFLKLTIYWHKYSSIAGLLLL